MWIVLGGVGVILAVLMAVVLSSNGSSGAGSSAPSISYRFELQLDAGTLTPGGACSGAGPYNEYDTGLHVTLLDASDNSQIASAYFGTGYAEDSGDCVWTGSFGAIDVPAEVKLNDGTGRNRSMTRGEIVDEAPANTVFWDVDTR